MNAATLLRALADGIESGIVTDPPTLEGIDYLQRRNVTLRRKPEPTVVSGTLEETQEAIRKLFSGGYSDTAGRCLFRHRGDETPIGLAILPADLEGLLAFILAADRVVDTFDSYGAKTKRVGGISLTENAGVILGVDVLSAQRKAIAPLLDSLIERARKVVDR